ncbi:MAG: hypothetical protein R3B74_17805 [Nitrospirales bacterium]|nr:hypothetical protein [Nitrospirales bacterium]
MDNTPTLTFQDLWCRWAWRPIRNCPGRFLLPLREDRLSFEQLTGRPCSPTYHHSPAAPDQVLVLPLPDGGLITYLKADGHLLHTLNTPAGFIRKLTQLGITGYGAPSTDQ